RILKGIIQISRIRDKKNFTKYLERHIYPFKKLFQYMEENNMTAIQNFFNPISSISPISKESGEFYSEDFEKVIKFGMDLDQIDSVEIFLDVLEKNNFKD